jgi:hypothetical protein
MKSAKRTDSNEINVRQAAELMRSLSNPNRLMIACAPTFEKRASFRREDLPSRFFTALQMQKQGI